MCCEPLNSNKAVGECFECGSPIDSDGESTDICAYSEVECDVCGYAPCDDSC